MENRIIYLKEESKTFPFSKTFYKVIEKDEENSVYLEVYDNEISINKSEEFFETVGFIKNKLCKESVEIERQEFDEFFIKTVGRINELSKL